MRDDTLPRAADDDPPPDLTCIHTTHGLCDSCRAEYEEDATAFIEFGQHPLGLARWSAHQAEVEAYHAAHPEEGQTRAMPERELPF